MLEAALSRERGAPTDVRAKAISNAAYCAYLQGDHERAKSGWDEAIQLWREVGDEEWIARIQQALGFIAADEGDYDAASAFCEQARTGYARIGDEVGAVSAVENLAGFALERGAYEEALRLYEEAVNTSRRIGHDESVGRTLAGLGCALALLDRPDDAVAALAESLQLAERLRLAQVRAVAFDGFAVTAQKKAQVETAARLLGAADAAYAASGMTRNVEEVYMLSEVRRTIKRKALEPLVDEARAMPPDDAVALALSITRDVTSIVRDRGLA